MHTWLDLRVRLARAPVVSIAPIRGRARGAGSEFVLACDLVADDVDGPRAEQFGYVNGAIADDQLDDEVAAIASRLARFDHDAIARTKSYVDQVTLPTDSELPPALAD
jgi:enoyl-CoA hydratase/carnithine racemase